jgi:ATP-dependent RNA helicase DeaD
MLSMGFLPDMRKLRRYLPADRESHMFSATMPARVQNLAKQFLRDPGFLSLSTGNVSVDAIKHEYYRVDTITKDRALVRIIEMENPDSALIFANTKREVEYLGTFLSNYGYDADSLTGDLSQKARERVMDKIRAAKLRFLVATDVAARGIDISDLSHVFMVDVPQDQEYYIHRAGRTARAGKTGTAISLVSIADETTLKRMAHKYAFELERGDMPSQEDVEGRVSERMTVTLESMYRDKSNLNRERLARFVPLIEELAQEEPELLAMLVDELYHDTLHGKPDGSTRASQEPDEAEPSDEPKPTKSKSRRRGRGNSGSSGGNRDDNRRGNDA